MLAVFSDRCGNARLDGAELLCIVKKKRAQEALRELMGVGDRETGREWGEAMKRPAGGRH